jgi:hypothetical protein
VSDSVAFVVKGLIELQDDYTGKLGLAEAALSHFTKENQESLLAVAGAFGLVTAAVALTAKAVYELGQRGAGVNDVRESLEHFTGSADAADAVLDKLRDGVKGTISDFTLMKDASRLLGAGVKLTADDFGVLGQASFVLQNRGLGGTKEMLDLVSDALTTGRTKALAAAVGVVAVDDAEAAYAKTLGVTKDQLSDVGKAEAHRIAVMRLLNAAVKDAGAQELDFGEKIEKAKAAVENYVDNLASAVAKSPMFAAAFDVIESAIKDAFGGLQEQAIQSVMEAIKKVLVVTIDFGLGVVEAVRVVHAAWAAVETVILGVEMSIVGAASMVVDAIADMAGAAEKLHLVPEGTAASLKEVATQLDNMALSLAKDTAEAARGVTGNSEFDKTLDKLGGTLFRVKDAVENADAVQKKSNETTDIAANNAKKLAAVQKELERNMIDRQKVEDELWKVEKKSLEETTQLWNAYFEQRTKNTGTSFDEQRAAIARWADDEVVKLDDSDRNWKEHYDAIQAVAKEKMEAVGMTWNDVRDKSLEALAEQRDAAIRTYEQMLTAGLHFSREVLDAQREKIEKLKDAARGMGEEYQRAHDLATAKARQQKEELEAVEKAARKAAEAARALGGSFEVTSANIEGIAAQMRLDLNRVMTLARKGFSFAEIVSILGGQLAENSQPSGPRIQGFADGGIVDIMVGERGPEIARVPLGTAVYPTGTRPGAAGGTTIIQNEFNIQGADEATARRFAQLIMRQLKTVRQFPAA